MKVIAFPNHDHQNGWSDAEREALLAVSQLARRGWTHETGVTESGDPQWYVLGPKPEELCELCVSRVDGSYVLEDGTGHLLTSDRNLDVVAAHLKKALRRPRSRLVLRIVLLWCTVRQVIHDRVEPVLTESEDLLVHFAPQLAAFA